MAKTNVTGGRRRTRELFVEVRVGESMVWKGNRGAHYGTQPAVLISFSSRTGLEIKDSHYSTTGSTIHNNS